MANDKKFVVKRGLATPNVDFANGGGTISATFLSTSNTLSFSGNTGQLFSITDSMSGTIFSVNDISGIPSIEVIDTGSVKIAETFGSVAIGANTITNHKFYVNGNSLFTNATFSNSATINNKGRLSFRTLNGNTVFMEQQDDDNFVLYTTTPTGASRPVYAVYANTNTSNLNILIPLQLSSTIVANSFAGSAGQVLTSSGSGVYWGAAGSGGGSFTFSTGLTNTSNTITVNAAYIATITSNNASFANSASFVYGKQESQLSVAAAANATFATTANNALRFNGKQEAQLSVANAVFADTSNNALRFNGKQEAQLSVANAVFATTAGSILGGGGFTGNTVSANATIIKSQSYNVNAAAGWVNMTMPSTVATGDIFIVHSLGGNTRILNNSINIMDVGSGNDLLLENGQTVWLQAVNATAVDILFTYPAGGTPAVVANSTFATSANNSLFANSASFVYGKQESQLSVAASNTALYLQNRTWETAGAIGSSVANTGAFTTLTASANVNLDSGTLFVDSVNNRVGVGNTNPSESLQVDGRVKTSTGGVVLGDTNAVIYRNSNNLELITYAGYGINLMPAGNVGIGSTTAPTKLYVNGHMSVANGFGIYANGVLGANGLVLTSNGTSLFWGSIAAAANATFATTANNALFANSASFVYGKQESQLSVANSAALQGATWQAPLGIGTVTANTGAFTSLTASANVNLDSGALFVDATTNRVGLANLTPITTLHVQGSSTIDSDDVNGTQLTIRGATNTNNRLYIGYDTDDNVGKITAITEGTSFRNLMLNAGGGNVGIGSATSAPTKLFVNGHMSVANGFGIYANGVLGTAGFVLTSNGSSLYWANASSISGTVTSANNASYLNGKQESQLSVASSNSANFANAAAWLGGFQSSYYTNATNITTGTLAEPRLPFRMNQNVRTTDDVTFANGTFVGTVSIGGNLILTGNLISQNIQSLSVIDPLIKLGVNNASDAIWGGFTFHYSGSGNTTNHAGLVRSPSTKEFILMSTFGDETAVANNNTININDSSFTYANLQVNFLRIGNNTNTSTLSVTNYTGTANNTSFAYGKQESQLSVANAVFATTAGSVLGGNVSGTVANANNASFLNGRIWETAGAIGSTVANTGAFTTLTSSGVTRIGQSVTQAAPSTTDILSTAHASISGQGGNYLSFGQYDSGSGFAQWIQSSFNNPTTAVYNIVLQPLGGNVAIGSTSAPTKLFVNGHMSVANGFGIYANGVLGSAGFVLTSNGSSLYWANAASISGTVASANNASFLAGRRWETAGAIGSTVANTGAFTTLTASANVNIDSGTLFVDGTSNRVGVNITTPLHAHHVSGSVLAAGDASSVAYYMNDSQAIRSSGTMYIDADTSGQNGFTRAGTGDLIFRTAAAQERMRIISGGNIGIGNTTPGQRLQVDGSVGIKNGLVANGTFGISGQVLTSNGTVSYWANTSAGGFTGNTVSANATIVKNQSYYVNAAAGWVNMTMPSTVVAGDIFIVHSETGNTRILNNSINIMNVGSGNDLLLESGQTVWVQAVNTSSVGIMFTYPAGGTPAVVANSTFATSANNALYLQGRTWETAGAIGSTVANTGTFTTLTASTISLNGNTTFNTSTFAINPTFKAYREAVGANTVSTASTVIDVSTFNVFNLSMTLNTTVSFTNPPASGTAYSFMLYCKQDGVGSRTITWPASVKWPNSSVPTMSTGANKIDVFNFFTLDGGTTYLGALSLANTG